MNKADFIIIGAAKSGTTTLCDRLGEHPEIFVSTPKEPKFFSIDDNYKKGVTEYEKIFIGSDKEKVRGEGSVNYAIRDYHPDCAARIHAYNPDIRLIYLVRNPIERLISHWRMINMSASKGKSLEESIEDTHLNGALVQASRYSYQMEPYLKLFSQGAVKVIFLEDLSENPQEVMKACYQHLGVETSWESTNLDKISNKTHCIGLKSELAKHLKIIGRKSRLNHLLPIRMKKFIKDDLGFWPGAPSAEISSEYLDILKDSLRGESIEFLERYGKSRGFWNM